MRDLEKLIDNLMKSEIDNLLKENKLMQGIEEYKEANKKFIYYLGSDITDKMSERYTNLAYAMLVLKALKEYKTSDNFKILGNFIIEIGESVKSLAKEVD